MEVNAVANVICQSPIYSGKITNNKNDVIEFKVDVDEKHSNLPKNSNFVFLKIIFTLKQAVNAEESTEYTQVIKINNFRSHIKNHLYMVSSILKAISNRQVNIFNNVRYNDIKINIEIQPNNYHLDGNMCSVLDDVELIFPENNQSKIDNNSLDVDNNIEHNNNIVINNIIQQIPEGDNNNILPECCNECITNLQNLWNKIKCW